MLPNLSIIVAALNEELLLASTVYAIEKSCRDYLNNYEIILVNDGSTDRTGEIMEDLARKLQNVSVIHHERRSGIGNVLRTGLKVVRYEYTMLLCGDGGVPGESLPPIFEQIGKADIIIPYMSNMRTIKDPFRYFLSRGYTIILNMLFFKNLRYYNGLPVYRTEHLRSLHIVSVSFAFQAEIILKLLKSGCTYVQVATLGAHGAKKRRSFDLQSLYEVAKIVLILIREIWFFNSVKQSLVQDMR